MSANPHVLWSSVVGDVDRVLGTTCAILGCKVWALGVVVHQEVAEIPVGGVLVDLCDREVAHVGVEINEKQTFVIIGPSS